MNTEQLELGLDLAPIIPSNSKLSIEEAFEEFHAANPHVYLNLRHLARQAVRAGRKKIGMKFLFERLRWEYAIRTNRPEGEWALNNNFSSRYSRLLMENEADLEGVFEIRELRERALAGHGL